jgi:hypothetical protein
MLEGETEGALPGAVLVDRGLLDDMRPVPFLNGELLSLGECFDFRSPGVQTKRNSFTYDPSRERLVDRIKQFAGGALDEEFSPTASRPVAAARAVGFDESFVAQSGKAPLDRHWFYTAQPSLIDLERTSELFGVIKTSASTPSLPQPTKAQLFGVTPIFRTIAPTQEVEEATPFPSTTAVPATAPTI